ncbi:RNA polymerase sigma factor [Puia dinghuensis]|uniref:RNA polymerase sigma-70 region 2 domain-containing protein n=1 Tax=Puia dinghuensis TaxID=1792502 RepID=A0A8J2UJ60_9BACT|nr:sigma-70 family RNA polymerase sigma factor [Puia dinghuensis]GGB26285.1 hypothetical protein GCM10011511_57790 [Puia dinghuensis]
MKENLGLKREKAIIKAYIKFQPRLETIAYNILEDEDLAKDAVANVFERLLKKIDGAEWGYRSVTFPYLYIAVRNQAIDFLRTEPKKLSLDSTIMLAFSGNTALSVPFEETYLDADVVDQMLFKISGYPPEDRQFLWKHIVEEKTLEQVSDELSIKLQTLASRKKRMLNDLRDHLKAYLKSKGLRCLAWITALF